ncbi:NADPH-dependent methylglyoxal reductase Gre2p [[Candida] jaroonii]|uniref:NADPH-dependent methylglyoxal reductase Gre2p n=1 Tax=[Candida] jaroonii TaxID=467808 RepID=A0ACA9Y8V8_9ASCO|nr:NADPH-dependent methylglyoxal reductase Gre2p [[Candida] jaroonii]
MSEIFVSGANGYIAQHIIKICVEKGYKVVGTVRSASKGDQLVKDFGDNFSYEIVENIGEPNAFDEALKKHSNVSVFLHTASPVRLEVEDAIKDIVEPAVAGTINALNAIKDYGVNVNKVVITSSSAAVIDAYNMTNPDGALITEESWNPIRDEDAKVNPMYAYFVSKRNAEKAAWEFVKTQDVKFTLNTVCPTLIFGPQAFDANVRQNLNSSVKFLTNLVDQGPDAEIFAFDGTYVDVRDVAKVHVHAFESDVTNFRYLPMTENYSFQTCADIINEKIPSLKGKAAIGKPGSGLDVANRVYPWDNSKTMAYVENPISLEQSVLDTINQYIENK